jgi:hypothetical protein
MAFQGTTTSVAGLPGIAPNWRLCRSSSISCCVSYAALDSSILRSRAGISGRRAMSIVCSLISDRKRWMSRFN